MERVAEKHAWAKGNTHSLNSFHDRTDNVRRGLEAVWPHQVHKMEHGILTSETGNTESEMLDDNTRRLTMNEITVGESILEHGDDGINIVG